MCAVSMIYDFKFDEWNRRYPQPAPYPLPLSPPTREEIEELRRLLERAREYDRKNNEPDCELAEKRKKLKDLAEQLGVKIDFV